MRLPCQRVFRPVSLLSISNVSSFRLLPLRVGKPLFTNGSIVPRARGVRFSLARFVSPPPPPPPPPPPELHETGTIRKRWNQATKYAETKRVHGTGSKIYAVVCGPKIQKPRIRHVVKRCLPTKQASVKALVTVHRISVLLPRASETKT